MAPKFDLSTPKGLMPFNGYISSKSYVEGYSYSQADADMFATCAGVPDKAKAPHAYRWYIHIAAIKGVRSLSLAPSSGSAPAAAPASTSRAAPAAKATKVDDDDDDDDDLFGDDEEEEAAKPAEKSRAEKMAEAKAAKDAKKKIDRSQIVFEVKPWDTETDLKGLFAKICKTEIEGLVWGEAHKLVPVAFGVKKLVLSCVVEDDKVGVEDITDVIEGFEDEVQSVDMTTMNRL
ncbi:unnamed protein product [Ectocarpus sp. 4 AP-2014]